MVSLGEGKEARVVYLKREMQVRWTTRLGNFLAGSGWVSRCVREATILEALERDDLPGPRWLATGEDDKGRAFLLVLEVPGAVPLASMLGGKKKGKSILVGTAAALAFVGLFGVAMAFKTGDPMNQVMGFFIPANVAYQFLANWVRR